MELNITDIYKKYRGPNTSYNTCPYCKKEGTLTFFNNHLICSNTRCMIYGFEISTLELAQYLLKSKNHKSLLARIKRDFKTTITNKINYRLTDDQIYLMKYLINYYFVFVSNDSIKEFCVKNVYDQKRLNKIKNLKDRNFSQLSKISITYELIQLYIHYPEIFNEPYLHLKDMFKHIYLNDIDESINKALNKS